MAFAGALKGPLHDDGCDDWKQVYRAKTRVRLIYTESHVQTQDRPHLKRHTRHKIKVVWFMNNRYSIFKIRGSSPPFHI